MLCMRLLTCYSGCGCGCGCGVGGNHKRRSTRHSGRHWHGVDEVLRHGINLIFCECGRLDPSAINLRTERHTRPHRVTEQGKKEGLVVRAPLTIGTVFCFRNKYMTISLFREEQAAPSRDSNCAREQHSHCSSHYRDGSQTYLLL